MRQFSVEGSVNEGLRFKVEGLSCKVETLMVDSLKL